jgi:hypothetical protein
VAKYARPRALKRRTIWYGWAPGRVARGLWPGRNLLRRGSDRAETALAAGLLAVFGVAAPLVATGLDGRFAGPLLSVAGVQLLAGVLLGVWFGARRLLDRRRLRGWEAEWAVFGPRWTRKRGGPAGDERARP